MKYDFKNNTYFATPKDNPKDLIEVIVGDDKQPNFLPQIKLQRWQNEVNFSARLKDFDNFTVSTKGEKIKAVGDKIEAHFYDIAPCEEHPEGAQEFEVILKEKPASNVIEFSLNTKGVDFFYQPFLKNENPDGSFWENNEGGKSSCPANVGGSYAVYASENKVNYVDGKEYKCGKVGHIFRPKIIDSVGTEVWGDLHIENGILSVTIPQDFLDKAVYPVIVDPTFGYTTNGVSSDVDISTNTWLGSVFTSSASSGDASSISFYAGTDFTGDLVKGILVLHSNLTIINNGIGNEVNVNTEDSALFTSSFSVSPLLSASTDYVISLVAGGNTLFVKYDTGSTNQGHKETDNNYTTPTNPSNITHNTNKYSIYCTYTAGGETVVKDVIQPGIIPFPR